jgi:type IV pilus assembly protein PilE
MTRSRERGVTLIELLTVMIILGIVAAIAIPSYRNYLLRAQRVDATTALLRIAAAQEKFYLQNNTYATDDQLADPPPGGLGIGATSERGYYNIAITKEDNLTVDYVATATPVDGGPQARDADCAVFTIDQAGARLAKSNADVENTATCWR